MDNELPTIAQLKTVVLPQLFLEPTLIGEYCPAQSNAAALKNYSDLVEAGSASALARNIGEIVSKLADADPQRIAGKSTWLDRMLGRELERQVRYQVARKALDDLLIQTEASAQGVRDTLRAIDMLMSQHGDEVARLEIHIRAGREFLDENPEVGLVAEAIEFDRPRERFARKLANLATLLTSHEMSLLQMKLTRAQAVDMLDRFSETTTMLVPVWRQHTLSLITTQNMSPALVTQATSAHRALMVSLNKSLEGIEH